VPGDHDHEHAGLTRQELSADPIDQFRKWFSEAGEVSDMPEAMTLATVDESGAPDARMVLMKGVDPDGFRFFTNYGGVKASQLETTPKAALVFHWPELDRQVRIRGAVEVLDPEESDRYFATRGRLSQVGAWASPQSQPLRDDRVFLDELSSAAEKRFQDQEVIPRPEHWGGYLLTPEKIEFWQGRDGRLHDRFLYWRETVGDNGALWQVTRLAP